MVLGSFGGVAQFPGLRQVSRGVSRRAQIRVGDVRSSLIEAVPFESADELVAETKKKQQERKKQLATEMAELQARQEEILAEKKAEIAAQQAERAHKLDEATKKAQHLVESNAKEQLENATKKAEEGEKRVRPCAACVAYFPHFCTRGKNRRWTTKKLRPLFSEEGHKQLEPEVMRAFCAKEDDCHPRQWRLVVVDPETNDR